jgi:CheY-like chemotaxis protein
MEIGKLEGCFLLIAEQHILVQMDLQKICEDAGARVVTANDRNEALALVEGLGFTAAVIDYSLAEKADGNFSIEDSSVSLGNRLTELGIPYVFCSARKSSAASNRADIEFIEKPFFPHEVIDALASALKPRVT